MFANATNKFCQISQILTDLKLALKYACDWVSKRWLYTAERKRYKNLTQYKGYDTL